MVVLARRMASALACNIEYLTMTHQAHKIFHHLYLLLKLADPYHQPVPQPSLWSPPVLHDI